MVGVFGLLSRKIIRRAKKCGVAYLFLFVHPDGRQLAEIGALLDAGRIRSVIDKIFPFEQAKEALAYLEQGRGNGVDIQGNVRVGSKPVGPWGAFHVCSPGPS